MDRLPHLTAVVRHCADLRDGVHGGAASRADKEALFARTVELLAPVAQQALSEVDDVLLLGTGSVDATGPVHADDGIAATWSLAWAEQRERGLPPVSLKAWFGREFHHPHLRGTTVHDWPLNVFDEEDALAQLPILRAIVAADLHNLVFRADFRIIPAVARAGSS
jgi:hypothetical protein